MDKELKGLCAGLFFGSLITGAIMVQCVPDTYAARVDAVKHGAARWNVDDYGHVQFEWITKK